MAQKYFGFNSFSHSYTILMCNASIEINIKAVQIFNPSQTSYIVE